MDRKGEEALAAAGVGVDACLPLAQSLSPLRYCCQRQLDAITACCGCLPAPPRPALPLPLPHPAVVIYYGSKPDAFRCPLCKAVYAATGPKWRLAYRFTLLEEWQADYGRNYRAVMFPDDDLVVSLKTAAAVPAEALAAGGGSPWPWCVLLGAQQWAAS